MLKTKCDKTASLMGFYWLLILYTCCFLDSIQVPRNSSKVAIIVFCFSVCLTLMVSKANAKNKVADFELFKY